MTEKINSIFSRKDLFLMEHTSNGSSTRILSMPLKKRRKIIYDNMHLMRDMTFTPVWQFPQMEPYVGPVDFTCIPYTERGKHSGNNQAVHFFLDDYRFRDAVWCNLERTTLSISKYDYCFTPDLSLWRDMPTDFYNMQNVFRTRFVGRFWQLCGYKVIPTASWGGLNTFSYCFDGLPENSIVAVSGMGKNKSDSAHNLWCYGLQRLEEAKRPQLIIVYGTEEDVQSLHTPLKFIPDFITTKLRNL